MIGRWEYRTVGIGKNGFESSVYREKQEHGTRRVNITEWNSVHCGMCTFMFSTWIRTLGRPENRA